MTQNVRNFWIELEVDGKKVPVATGPVHKDGGFSLTIKQRDNGGITRAVEVIGVVDPTGTREPDILSTIVYLADQEEEVGRIETTR